MTDFKMIVFVCCFVFLAGFIDSIAGGGGLISLPVYIAAGVPAHMALGSNKFSSSLGTFISAVRFVKNKKIHIKSASIAVVTALVGSAAGAYTVLFIDDRVVKILLVIIIPCVAIFLMTKKKFGTENEIHLLNMKKIAVISAIIGLIMGFYDGFFGPGTGTFLIFAFTTFLRLDLASAAGNAKLINLASNIGALSTFLLNGQVMFKVAVPAALFAILGNFIGSGLAIKNGSKIIRPVLVLVMGILIINIISELFSG